MHRATRPNFAAANNQLRSIGKSPTILPDKVEKQHKAVGDSLTGPHDEDIEVNSDGDSPEKRAAVGESGYRPLDGAVQRVGAENSPDSKGVGDG